MPQLSGWHFHSNTPRGICKIHSRLQCISTVYSITGEPAVFTEQVHNCIKLLWNEFGITNHPLMGCGNWIWNNNSFRSLLSYGTDPMCCWLVSTPISSRAISGSVKKVHSNCGRSMETLVDGTRSITFSNVSWHWSIWSTPSMSSHSSMSELSVETSGLAMD